MTSSVSKKDAFELFGSLQPRAVPKKKRLLVDLNDDDDDDNSVVVLNGNDMKELGLSDLDYVILKSDHWETVCEATDNCQPGEVLLNRVVRRNLGVNRGDIISVYAATGIKEGISADIVPLEDTTETVSRGMLRTVLALYLKSKDRPVHKGDIISIDVDLESVRTLEYKVLRTDPSPACFLGSNTKIHFGVPINGSESVDEHASVKDIVNNSRDQTPGSTGCSQTPLKNEVDGTSFRSAHQLAECPVCLEEYQTNKKPMVLLCGHSVCENCLDGCSRCTICRSSIFEVSLPNGNKQKASVGYEILELNRYLQEISTKKEEAQAGGELTCTNCQSGEKAAKMRICETCLEADGLNRDVEEEMVTSYILCAVCFADNHNGHKLFKYLPWKIQGMARESSRNGIENVVGMKELCDAEAAKGNEEYKRWMKEMKAFSQFEASAMKLEDALALRNQLNEESEVVCKAADDTLLPLRSFTHKVKESADRLQELRKQHEKKETQSDTVCVSFGEPYKCSGSNY